jgi:signal peptidase I
LASKSIFSTISRRLLDWVQSFFLVEGKMRANAHNWLELSDKVYHFRRDQMSSKDLADLQQKREGLRTFIRDRADAGKLKLGIEALEGVLRRAGGKIYPKSTTQEYVEFFLVAAIVVLGVRTYFVQPFKIPTNSMWPSYNGMTPYVYHDPAQAPGVLQRLARLAAFGASHYEIVAPANGKISVPVSMSLGGKLYWERKDGRKWGIFPAKVHEYEFLVGDETVRLQVPEDFDFDWVVRETFGYTTDQLYDLARRSKNNGNGEFRWVVLDPNVIRGKPLLSFDIMTGDQLFVDRISYHFVRPKVGDGFVFRTGNIQSIGSDQYYIKRLVGVPGDNLEIREPILYRNGAPITGASAFDRNARREKPYGGYFNGHPHPRYPEAQLFSGEVITIPGNAFLALGDNSANSLDGRYWGFVPRKDVVGRPLFVYYPFNSHWGTAP